MTHHNHRCENLKSNMYRILKIGSNGDFIVRLMKLGVPLWGIQAYIKLTGFTGPTWREVSNQVSYHAPSDITKYECISYNFTI
jgi:hypothetical protein